MAPNTMVGMCVDVLSGDMVAAGFVVTSTAAWAV